MSERMYPTLSNSELEKIVPTLVTESCSTEPGSSFADSVAYAKCEDEVDSDRLKEFCDELTEACEKRFPRGTKANSKDSENFEGIWSSQLHKLLVCWPPQVLDDPGFWRYVSLAIFRFIAQRENLSEDNIRTYMNGKSSTECVPLRMFLRGQAVAVPGLEGDDLTSAIPKGTDFWRSHIIRVQTGAYPAVARPFAIIQRDHRMKTNPVRDFAKRLNRVNVNVVLAVYEEPDGDALIEEIRSEHDLAQVAGANTKGA
jgi:hypothetical protein